MTQKLVVFLCLVLAPLWSHAQRQDILINDQWAFYPQCDVSKQPTKQTVKVPHSWNLQDVFNGQKYDRSAYIYERMLHKDASLQGKRVFLKFDAVGTVAEVAVNKQYIGQHKGGYTAFCMEITQQLHDGDNLLSVLVSNAYRMDVAPLAGDFNMYGGITRPVHLLITEADCISPMDHASSGVYIHQQSVTKEKADLSVETVLSLSEGIKGQQLSITVSDPQGKPVARETVDVSSERMQVPLSIAHPHLWNGRQDPCLYSVKVELLKDGKTLDAVCERTGLRYFSANPDQGFFLNGKHLDLHGVCRHEEGYQTGNLYNEAAMRQDAENVAELGSTGIRFVHYPHSRFNVQLYDSLGIVVWYELNLAGPGGYSSPGYVKHPALEASVMNNLEEMILQNYNSPSICFWSLCNELSFKYDEPATFLRRLNQRAKQLDPQRLTTLAICYDQAKFQGITDVLGWNKYYGWYNPDGGGIGKFMDEAIQQAGQQPVGLCEYGAAASIHQHSFEKKVSNKIHFEEYQAKVHEDNWMQMQSRPQVWCKFIWQMNDNPSSIRDEGDTRGMNDKGIITYDRQVKKDAFYFYKANWNSAPMLHIAAKRFTKRKENVTDIKAYTNQPRATLFVNGKKIGTAKKDSLGRITFTSVHLQDGQNRILIKTGKLSDSCIWTVDTSFSTEQDASSKDNASGLNGNV